MKNNKNPEIVTIFCQHCKKSLIEIEKTIAGNPSIHFKAVKLGSKEEKKDIFLSAKFDDFRKAGHKFKKGTVVQLFCPHCGKEFERHFVKCSSCKEELIVLSTENGTMHIMGICPTVGCLHHKSNLELPTEAPTSSP